MTKKYDKKDFLYGVCYYPDHWEPEELEQDVKDIKNAGFNVIRTGEFSWSQYEPEEGVYNFGFLHQAMDMLNKYGIKVILGTPTAGPPLWMTQKYPEILCVDENGKQAIHGSRQHHNHTSPKYLEFCRRITERMADEFKDYPNLIGWQIDNELHCHRNKSFAESDDIAFRKWLKDRYGTIEKLNEVWGTVFWSLEFRSFDDVFCPRATVTHRSPEWQYDFLLFTSDAAVRYAKLQYEILKKKTPDKFVTHNALFGNLDYHKLTGEALDFLNYDSYPMFNEGAVQGASRGDTYKLSKVRCESPYFMVAEQQAGPGGQMSYMLATPEPGQIRLWAYQSVAHGARSIIYFRYRTDNKGQEQLWYGYYDHATAENYRTREIRKVGEELRRLGPILFHQDYQAKVAVYASYENVCSEAIETFVSTDDWHVMNALNRAHIGCDFLRDIDRIGEYQVVIAPHASVMSEADAEKFKAYAKAGGTVIFSARSGIKDEHNNYYRMEYPSVLTSSVGATVEWFTVMRPFVEQKIEMNGKIYPVKQYMEVLKTAGAKTVARYTDRFCAGKSAVTKNKVGKGWVYYVGTFVDADTADLYTELVREYVPSCAPKLSPEVEAVELTDYLVLLNYRDFPVEIPYEERVDIITGKAAGKEIPPYGVYIIKK